MLDVTTDAIFVRDLDNRIIFWNKGAENLYGWLAHEAYGKEVLELLYDDESPEEVETAFLAVLKQGKWQGELTRITKSGKNFSF